MASYAPDRPDAGFATPVAMIATLAITTLTSAVLLASIAELQGARAHLRRSQIVYALDGAQRAALQTVDVAQPRRLTWTFAFPSGEVRLLAEPEASKLRPEAAATDLSADLLQRMHAAPDALRSALSTLRTQPPSQTAIASLDPASAWSNCARSFVSPWGTAKNVYLNKAVAPQADALRPLAGTTWRIVASMDGWIDDRTITLTGDPQAPAIWRERTLRRAEGPWRCEDLFEPATEAARPATP